MVSLDVSTSLKSASKSPIENRVSIYITDASSEFAPTCKRVLPTGFGPG